MIKGREGLWNAFNSKHEKMWICALFLHLQCSIDYSLLSTKWQFLQLERTRTLEKNPELKDNNSKFLNEIPHGTNKTKLRNEDTAYNDGN